METTDGVPFSAFVKSCFGKNSCPHQKQSSQLSDPA